MFIHLDKIKEKDIKVIESPKGRFYVTPEGNKYPSITTLLGSVEKPWLQEWRTSLGDDRANKEMKRAADRGTAVHSMIEKLLNNEESPTSGFKIEHITEYNALKLHLKRINNIYCQETALYSDVLKVAGRVDCIAEYKGELAIVDFKTSTNDKKHSMIEDYYLQTTAYAVMFQELYDVQVDNIVILMSSEKGAVPLVFKAKVDDYIEPLIKRINTYYSKH